ncbi:DUF2273 domain-containing protein [Anaerococcus sp. AGMB09787]|uniref:DUF2273 domain-containing protein n=1 Tax=Anaerococcus sp. AGMB09787 TaxID=2922869 RepID=UPI001FB0204A|nr:DUF2273 domain-containing protein [Anaerococcus sp. AGMB09787]
MNHLNDNTDRDYAIYDLEIKEIKRKNADRQRRRAFLARNKGKIISLIISVLTLICLFNFGFVRTLGIWVVMIIGYTIGAFIDRDARYIKFLRRIFS